jgi:hypothetical protein
MAKQRPSRYKPAPLAVLDLAGRCSPLAPDPVHAPPRCRGIREPRASTGRGSAAHRDSKKEKAAPGINPNTASKPNPQLKKKFSGRPQRQGTCPRLIRPQSLPNPPWNANGIYSARRFGHG